MKHDRNTVDVLVHLTSKEIPVLYSQAPHQGHTAAISLWFVTQVLCSGHTLLLGLHRTHDTSTKKPAHVPTDGFLTRMPAAMMAARARWGLAVASSALNSKSREDPSANVHSRTGASLLLTPQTLHAPSCSPLLVKHRYPFCVQLQGWDRQMLVAGRKRLLSCPAARLMRSAQSPTRTAVGLSIQGLWA